VVARLGHSSTSGMIALSEISNVGPTMSAVTVLSMGYEGKSLSDYIAVLQDHGVRQLLDIRLFPFSRRLDYRKGVLSQRLAAAGVEYCHLRVAGNPFYKEKHDIWTCLQHYKQYLSANPEIVEQIAAELSEGPVAMLCYERAHYECHRSVLLEAIAHSGRHLEVIKVDTLCKTSGSADKS